MQLYESAGPNPKTVRMFLTEKGLDLPTARIDIRAAENRAGPYLAVNPTGQTPALELDDGTVITEITAICEYLEELHPTPSLFGTTPEQRAETRMWTRRIDLNILEPLLNGYRYGEGLSFFENRVRCIPQAADDLKAIGRQWLAWLDTQMAGKTWICGERYSFADLLLFVFLDFLGKVAQKPDPALVNLAAWEARMRARPGFSK